ncbi:putative odorant receptor 71a isoform X2 [Drosophila ficusphila]|uniref:putative odorant receptor 71a isoform X2 n=1 Tax=Drosophila ficusphila TaxID=30025 RepID=UPI0007E7970B|nr:putative odorant receptor 71a isoform X2 [Drosophila ficusphila]
MDYDPIRPVRYPTRVLEYCRLWPEKGSVLRPDWINWQGYLLHVIVTLIFVILLWVEAILSKDLEHTAEILLFCLTTTALVAKILNNWKNAHVAQNLLNEWSTLDLFKLKTKQEVDMWKFEHRRYSRVFVFYVMCSAGVIPFILIQPLFDVPNELPFAIWTPFNWHQKSLFWYPFIYEAIAIPILCACNITMDGVNWYMMLHLSLCLRMLGKRLSKLHHDDIKLKDRFLELVLLHQKLKRQALDIENFISKSIFTQILSPIMQDLPGFAAMMQYLLSMVMQIMLPSIYGNAVIDSANMLTNSMYNSDWPDMSPQMRRLILMFMVYLNRPMSLWANGFFQIGLPLFTKVINQAYSLLALLLNMNK